MMKAAGPSKRTRDHANDAFERLAEPLRREIKVHCYIGILTSAHRHPSLTVQAAIPERLMNPRSYTTAFTVNQSPEEAFTAINNVPAWWSGSPGVEGSTDKLGDEFSYRYEPHHFSKQKITDLVPGKKVVWRVLESKLNFVENKSEWKGTEIRFDITRKGNKTEVRFTHVGLVPDIECFDACSDAWGSYIKGSLRQLITAGKAAPNRKERALQGKEASP
jgi:hypothetical protein